MKKRTKKGQKAHDEGVSNTANWYKNRGYTTYADLPDWKRPKNIDGFIPDVIAKKGKKEILIEVETEKTANSDVKQQKAFKSYVKNNKNKRFRKKIV